MCKPRGPRNRGGVFSKLNIFLLVVGMRGEGREKLARHVLLRNPPRDTMVSLFLLRTLAMHWIADIFSFSYFPNRLRAARCVAAICFTRIASFEGVCHEDAVNQARIFFIHDFLRGFAGGAGVGLDLLYAASPPASAARISSSLVFCMLLGSV